MNLAVQPGDSSRLSVLPTRQIRQMRARNILKGGRSYPFHARNGTVTSPAASGITLIEPPDAQPAESRTITHKHGHAWPARRMECSTSI